MFDPFRYPLISSSIFFLIYLKKKEILNSIVRILIRCNCRNKRNSVLNVTLLIIDTEFLVNQSRRESIINNRVS